ncbi:MAG: SGNH/GDSL hydrolase family protein [Candidatus Sumerlaeia bacterium]|nr:SGNH/GDSL hydrolase family protein [Candidatus Sumerlaeia bacterium]
MTLKPVLVKVLARSALVVGGTLVGLLLLEIFFRLFFPQVMLTPRYDYLPEIGIINFPGVKMQHRRPGVFHFTYTTNAERYRGELIPFDDVSEKIVVLGDSFAFGYGVEDDETFSARLERNLGGRYRVVNLGNGGWGLTHQIVRYLTFGAKYHPKIVILQFCKNDPEDNLLTPLVTWNDSRTTFVLHRIEQKSINRFRRIISWSKPVYTLLTGHSQTYNFLRNRLYHVARRKDQQENISQVQTAGAGATATGISEMPRASSVAEDYYNDLLEHFARWLHDSGVRLIMISVQGHLETFPAIKTKVVELNREGVLDYLDTREWFDLGPDYASPEGHDWGTKAHARVAEELARHVQKCESVEPQKRDTHPPN